ncbi:hypothetical protein NXS19_007510 [Fusarium pseudograminearum]|nr:hypothetical protein NXS19_007510 [Fusarium pseudograminearum]
MEEFNKWVGRELSRGITAVSDIATFQATLDIMPLDAGLIADAVYGNSTTMDGRHFAEEFIRRKKLAERGVVEKQPDNKGGTVAVGVKLPRREVPAIPPPPLLLPLLLALEMTPACRPLVLRLCQAERRARNRRNGPWNDEHENLGSAAY